MGKLMQLVVKAYQAAHGATGVPEISVEDLKAAIDKKEDLLVLDVREKSEYDTAKIPGAVLIPMSQVPDKLGEIPKDKPIAVHCHHGGRSARVVQFLKKNGYTNAVNVEGGIDAWSDRIDPTVPKY